MSDTESDVPAGDTFSYLGDDEMTDDQSVHESGDDTTEIEDNSGTDSESTSSVPKKKSRKKKAKKDIKSSHPWSNALNIDGQVETIFAVTNFLAVYEKPDDKENHKVQQRWNEHVEKSSRKLEIQEKSDEPCRNPDCRSDKTWTCFYQTRSADEPMSVFVICSECAGRFRVA